MITTTREVTLLDGRKFVLGTSGIPQIWQIDLTIRHLDTRTGIAGNVLGVKEYSFHSDRTPLEQAGMLPQNVVPATEHGCVSVEDMVLGLLHRLGVRFED